jgi:hypothetical protein
VHADGQHSGGQRTEDGQRRRGGNAAWHWRWPFRRALTSRAGHQRRALDRIEQALVAEDPGFGARFAFFTMLTRQEAMPETEQVPAPLHRFLRRAVLLPILAAGLAALLAASWLTSGRQACPAGPNAAAHALASASRAARCQPSPAIRLDPMPAH